MLRGGCSAKACSQAKASSGGGSGAWRSRHFTASASREYAQVMVEQATAHTRDWRDGETRDMAEEMMALTLIIAVKTLFGIEFTEQAKRVGPAVTLLMRYQLRRLRSPVKIPMHWPTPSNVRADRAYEYPRFARLRNYRRAAEAARRRRTGRPRRSLAADERDG